MVLMGMVKAPRAQAVLLLFLLTPLDLLVQALALFLYPRELLSWSGWSGRGH
jgi:hypothetical protein